MASIAIDGTPVHFDRDPDVCPVCHHAVSPRRLSGTFAARSSGGSNRVQISYQCASSKCERQFIATFEQHLITQPYFLRSTAPASPTKPSIPAEVADVSRQFAAIYEQADAAEAYGLSEIAGVGYRKALEYLVKDFCISEHPDDAEAIKAKFLGEVIDKYVDSANIKACAKRAAWLGNDETHYVRRWVDKDLQDLRILIQLTMGWIREHVLTKKYLAEMA